MTDHDRLFDTVLSAPDDDTPRLIYADFLEEQGGIEYSIRAKFIRAATDLDRRPWNDPARDRLERLCEQYQARVYRWDDERHPLLALQPYRYQPYLVYDRGIPVLNLTLDQDRPTGPLPDLPSGWAAAVQVYASQDERAAMERITARMRGEPLAGRVVAATVGGHFLGPADFLAGYGSVFPRLVRLTLFAPALTDADVTATAALRLPLLRELNLAAIDALSTAGLRELVRGPLCRELRVLKIDIRRNPRDQFPDLADRLHVWPEPFQRVGWGGYNVPQPDHPPLLLLFDDGIPF